MTDRPSWGVVRSPVWDWEYARPLWLRLWRVGEPSDPPGGPGYLLSSHLTPSHCDAALSLSLFLSLFSPQTRYTIIANSVMTTHHSPSSQRFLSIFKTIHTGKWNVAIIDINREQRTKNKEGHKLLWSLDGIVYCVHVELSLILISLNTSCLFRLWEMAEKESLLEISSFPVPSSRRVLLGGELHL